jgi:uncharacterized protein with HEPN domain
MNPHEQQIHKLLEDIFASAKRIEDRLLAETRESFLGVGGMDAQDIVARRLTIIGEASAALLKKYPEFCARNKDIPLRKARGMRNALVHDYDGINWEQVWDTAQDEIPKLMEAIKPFLPRSD